jgi:hypothetical protein
MSAPAWWTGTDEILGYDPRRPACTADPAISCRTKIAPGGRLFSFSNEPMASVRLVVPIRDATGPIDGHVAWDAPRERKWWLAADGKLRWLGLDFAEAILRAAEGPKAVTVFSTPAEWLRSGGEGLVALDWDQFDFEPLIRFEAVNCSSAGLAGRLEKAVRDAFKPPFRIAHPVPAPARAASHA